MDILQVENEKCIGCGACISIDEEHFDWNDEGLSMAISNNNLKSEKLQDAIESCPTGAIMLAKGDDAYDGDIEQPTEENNINATVMASKKEENA